MQNASQKKVNGDFSILNGDFSVQIFQKRFQLVFWKFSVNCFPETFLHSEWRNLHSLFLRSVFTMFFAKYENANEKRFSKKHWRFLHSEWRFLHSIFFQKRFELSFEKKTLQRLFSIHMFFRSVFVFFEKKTIQGIFSIQNGEISILNEDFSIHFFQKRFD